MSRPRLSCMPRGRRPQFARAPRAGPAKAAPPGGNSRLASARRCSSRRVRASCAATRRRSRLGSPPRVGPVQFAPRAAPRGRRCGLLAIQDVGIPRAARVARVGYAPRHAGRRTAETSSPLLRGPGPGRAERVGCVPPQFARAPRADGPRSCRVRVGWCFAPRVARADSGSFPRRREKTGFCAHRLGVGVVGPRAGWMCDAPRATGAATECFAPNGVLYLG